MRIFSIGILLVSISCFAGAQGPGKMDNLTVSDRAEWRKILKWPDSCEAGLPDYQKYHSDSGIAFNRLGAHEYLVAIGCSGSASVFIYYRETLLSRRGC